MEQAVDVISYISSNSITNCSRVSSVYDREEEGDQRDDFRRRTGQAVWKSTPGRLHVS